MKVLSVLVLALVLTGCASAGPRHIATVSAVGVHATLSAFQDSEAKLVCGLATAPAAPACVTPAVHQQIAAQLVTAFGLDADVARLVRTWPEGTVPPEHLPTLLADVTRIINDMLALIPSSSHKTQLVAMIGGR